MNVVCVEITRQKLKILNNSAVVSLHFRGKTCQDPDLVQQIGLHWNWDSSHLKLGCLNLSILLTAQTIFNSSMSGDLVVSVVQEVFPVVIITCIFNIVILLGCYIFILGFKRPEHRKYIHSVFRLLLVSICIFRFV